MYSVDGVKQSALSQPEERVKSAGRVRQVSWSNCQVSFKTDLQDSEYKLILTINY